MTDLGNPYQALGKETVRTSYEQSHKETCLKFSPTAWGMKPHIGGFCSPRRGGNVIRNFAPPKFRKVKPPTKNTINKECKCGKNREAFINFVVETKK